MESTRKQLLALIEQKAIPADKIEDAFRVSKVTPENKAWRTFIDQLLLWLGSLTLGFSMLFFIAYNWTALGRFAKFGLVEICIVLTIAAYWKFNTHKVAGKTTLLLATILLGVLLALFGQTYQTGADTWQLFFTWALLALPWVIISRFPVLWLVWLALINLSLILYFLVFRGIFGGVFDIMFGTDRDLFGVLFLLNTLVLIGWEFLAQKKWQWMAERWAIRLLAVAGGVPVTWAVQFNILQSGQSNFVFVVLWIIWLAAIFRYYRYKKPDLFMLAGACLSGIVVIVTFLARHMLSGSDYVGGFFFLSLIVIGLGSGAAFWLKQVHKEMQP